MFLNLSVSDPPGDGCIGNGSGDTVTNDRIREVLLLLVENYNQYPAQLMWNTIGWGNFCMLSPGAHIYKPLKTATCADVCHLNKLPSYCCTFSYMHDMNNNSCLYSRIISKIDCLHHAKIVFPYYKLLLNAAKFYCECFQRKRLFTYAKLRA